MSTVLSNGVIVPDVGSTNWASDLETNWTLLNALIGAVGANVRLDRPNIWTAAQTFSDGIYGDLDGTAAMAVSDANGNEIATTYALKTDVTALQTAVSGKAADSEVVHLAGAETITGDKTFTGAVVTHNITPETNGTYQLGSAGLRWTRLYASESLYIHYEGLTFGTPPTQATYFGLRLNDKTGTAYGDVLAKSDPDGYNALRLRCRNTDGTNTYDRQISLIVQQNGITQLIPNASGVFDLGRASAKWKTLNGINPGALSFPANSYVAIDTTDFNKSGGRNTYTPSSDGWIGIQVSSVSYNANYYVFIGRYTDGSSANPSYWSQGQVSPLMANFEGYMGQVFIPVIGGKVYHIRVNGDFSSGGYIRAYFFPCLGNV